jgi:hypothetical protein
MSHTKPVSTFILPEEKEVIENIRTLCKNKGFGSVNVTVQAGHITMIRREHITLVNGGGDMQ